MKKNAQTSLGDFLKNEKIEESELVDFIAKNLSPYFKVFRELRGNFNHWNQNRVVIIDLGLYPKKETVEKGFPEIYFGIEVKCFDIQNSWDKNPKKFRDTISQCITYKYSKFGKSKIEPAFILLADNFGVKMKSTTKDSRRAFSRFSNKLLTFSASQNIGRLEIKKNENIYFRMDNYVVWSNEEGFKNKAMLNLYSGNRSARNNPLNPVKDVTN